MKKFYLGMDIGTESVGMACTDENYNLLRARGKDLWAVRLFEEASDAKSRRAKRTARRRMDRRKKRIDYLQAIFAPYMDDDKFFLRLNNSGFCEEDKADGLNSRFSLFADGNYTDADFYAKYPTIFHLRDALCRGEKGDLRHYYLALHHIIKYRGHFLFEGENISTVRDLKMLINNFNIAYADVFDETSIISLDKCDIIKTVALKRAGLKDKQKELFSELGFVDSKSDAKIRELLSLMLGATAKTDVIFDNEEYKDEKMKFDGLTDEKFGGKSSVFADDEFSLLASARAIYNYFLFEKVLDDSDSISESMIKIYEKHKEDLRQLKEFVKENAKEEYNRIFRKLDEKDNYASYIGHSKKRAIDKKVKKCKSQEDFYEFLKGVLPQDKYSCEFIDKIYADMDEGNYLPKIIYADKGVFPHQINFIELEKILDNLATNFPEFAKVSDDGISAVDKIKKLFLFKIPYYVGPLNDAHGTEDKGAWIKRKDGYVGEITPWNFDAVVDRKGCNERFIRRMTNKCSYIYGEDVLPKHSMYYQAFDTLNQINKLKIDEQPISVELKKAIFEDLFLKYKKVTVKNIATYLKSRGLVEGEVSITGGFDGDIKASMSSYVLLKDKLGDIVDEKPEIAEDIILWHTLNTDKKVVEEQIKEKYGKIACVKDKIKQLKGITSFKDFGRLSKQLIDGIVGGVDYATGKVYTILERLFNTNQNFNEIYNDERYEFRSKVEEENGSQSTEITLDDVNDLYVSPMIRRGIWQSLLMVDEYVNAVGKAPDKIFVEVTREHDKETDKNKKRTKSRREQIKDLYKSCEKDCGDINKLLTELNGKSDLQLRQERLFLYFMQLGRCAYTGERISLENLPSNTYDVDHIVPQSFTKDDSLDNKVLVLRSKNAEKTNIYPLPQGFTNQQGFWKVLKAHKFMSEKKYKLLTRVKPLDNDDFREFVNRQIVITNQTVKAVAELLKRKYGPLGTEIVYSKAVNVSEFKNKFEIVKCRETNDLHHARDAYLNIVVGNIFNTKFNHALDHFYRDKEGALRKYNLKNIFEYEIEGAWKGKEQIAQIKSTVEKHSMIVTRYAFTNKGEFYNETVLKAKDSPKLPRKDQFPYNLKDENGNYKYGGYSTLSRAYFVAFEHKKGKKRNKVICGFPVIEDYLIKNLSDNEQIIKIKEYFETKCGFVDVKIIVPKIKTDTLVSYNGTPAYITGASDNRIVFSNAIQLYSDNLVDAYVKSLIKIAEREKNGELPNATEQETFDMRTSKSDKEWLYVNKEKNIQLYEYFVAKLDSAIYKNIPAYVELRKNLVEGKKIFEGKTTFEQIKGLLQIVRFLRRGDSSGCDLSFVERSKRSCALRVGYDITNVKFEIINQSPCGLTVRKIEV